MMEGIGFVGGMNQVGGGRRPGCATCPQRSQGSRTAVVMSANPVSSRVAAGTAVKVEAGKDSYDNLVRQAESSGKVIVLKVTAKYCDSCKKMEPKFRRLSKLYNDFTYYDIDYETNKELSKTIGVKNLPHFHVFDGKSKRSDNVSCTWTQAGKLRDLLDGFAQ